MRRKSKNSTEWFIYIYWMIYIYIWTTFCCMHLIKIQFCMFVVARINKDRSWKHLTEIHKQRIYILTEDEYI